MYSLKNLQESVSDECFSDIIGMVEEFVGEEQWNALDAALGEQGATNKIARDIAGNLLGLGKRKESAEKKESTNNKEVTKTPKKNPPAPSSSGSGIVVAGKSLNPPAKKRSPKKNDKPDKGSDAAVLASNAG